MPQQSPAEPDSDERADFIASLRELADFLAATPDAPLPHGNFGRHYHDADDFDRAAAGLGGTHYDSPPYEHCVRLFGAISFDLQTNGRAAQQVRLREERIAAREAELGLSELAQS